MGFLVLELGDGGRVGADGFLGLELQLRRVDSHRRLRVAPLETRLGGLLQHGGLRRRGVNGRSPHSNPGV